MVEVTNGGEKIPQHWRGGEAGWTADSDGGKRPEEILQAGAATGEEIEVGGGEGVVNQHPHPDPLLDPLENAETGVSGLSSRSLRGAGVSVA